MEAGKWARVYNLNGSIEFSVSPDDKVHVIAEKNTRRGPARDVYFEVIQSSSGNLTICAIFYEETRCEEDFYSSRSRNNENNRVSVDMRVQLPRNTKWQARLRGEQK